MQWLEKEFDHLSPRQAQRYMALAKLPANATPRQLLAVMGHAQQATAGDVEQTAERVAEDVVVIEATAPRAPELAERSEIDEAADVHAPREDDERATIEAANANQLRGFLRALHEMLSNMSVTTLAQSSKGIGPVTIGQIDSIIGWLTDYRQALQADGK